MTFPPETVERVARAIFGVAGIRQGLSSSGRNAAYESLDDKQREIVRDYATAALAAAWEWKDPAIELPKKPGKESYEYVDCLIIKKNGDVLFRPWNCEHEVFDDEDYDDFYCNAEDVKLWCEIVRPPRPADVKGEG